MSFAVGESAAQVNRATGVRPAQPTPKVALLDISYIFKHHTRFKSMMTDMKTSVQQAETWVKSEREALRKMAEGMQDYRPGTPDHKAMQEEMTKRKANVAAQIELQRKNFLQMESKIYHTVYQEVLQEVDYYCKANGIAMVLRFNGESPNGDNPQDVLRFINKPVVWYNQGLDITGIVLSRLNRSELNPGLTPGGGNRVGTQPARPTAHGVPLKR